LAQIHILEDDEAFACALAELLVRQGHEPTCFATPHEFFYQLSKRPPRCVIIDWMLPEMNGLEVVKRTRQLVGGQMGVLLLTALDAQDKAIAALGAGADDYLVKPVADGLLAARIEALLRRLVPAQTSMAKRIELGPYALDLSTRVAKLNGRDVGLAPREFDLAWVFFAQPSRLFTRDELLALIWGKGSDFGSHTVAQYVYALRKKLELVDHGFRLQSVYATGYRLEWIDAPAATVQSASNTDATAKALSSASNSGVHTESIKAKHPM
jgi:two-component system, OmpR family, phosphate regulon response regulator PhoB